jgi:predicted ATPase
MRAASELFLGDAEASSKILFEQTDLAERHGFTFWQVVSGFYHAVVAAYEGDPTAVMRAEMSITLLGSLGVEVWLPSFLASLATANLFNGQLDEAERFYAEGRTVADRIGAHYWTPEIIRQQGALLVARGQEGALGRFREAAALARQQGATLLELWALTSICEHGGHDADRRTLASLVEGLGPDADDLADVQVALAALDKRA